MDDNNQYRSGKASILDTRKRPEDMDDEELTTYVEPFVPPHPVSVRGLASRAVVDSERLAGLLRRNRQLRSAWQVLTDKKSRRIRRRQFKNLAT